MVMEKTAKFLREHKLRAGDVDMKQLVELFTFGNAKRT